jgi:formate hydrogenlyase transcriptional activator
VFPIELPALRERREDIPLIARHFVERAARLTGRRISTIAPEALERLVAYDWPGNVRELQNVIERAASLSRGPELRVDWDLQPTRPGCLAPFVTPVARPKEGRDEVTESTHDTPGRNSQTLEAVEREHFIATLRSTGGVIEGPTGAARLLGLKPSTARFRIRKLGIRRDDYRVD